MPDAQAVIDAVSSPVRREILWLTWNEERSVGELGEHVDVTGPTLSSHLACLRDAGLVRMRADGNFRRYRCDQDTVRRLVPLLATSDDRWLTADDLPEQALAAAGRSLAVTVAVDVAVAPADAFDAFADGERFASWLGVPVRIRDRSFRATLEWGTEVRGTYEVISPPDLIAMRWDFDDDQVPIPGRELVAYLRVHRRGKGSRVEVHQLAADETQAAFLTEAWSMVLGRFVEGAVTPTRRKRRPKRRSPAPR